MIARFEPSGTQIHNRKLMVRIDLVPEPGDKTYPIHHVNMPVVPPDYKGEITQEYLDSLPHVWQTNPCLCYFTPAPELATPEGLLDYLKVFTPDRIATIDHVMPLLKSADYISPYMRVMPKWSDTKVSAKDAVDLIASINDSLKKVPAISLASGKVQDILSGSITVGSAAISREYSSGALSTLLGMLGPASGAGIIDTVQMYFNTAGTGVKVGLFYLVSGTTYTCRSGANPGNVAAGSTQTIAPLVLAVQTGDQIGCYYATGGLALGLFGSNGRRSVSGEYCDAGDSADFSTAQTYIISLYGTGSETAAVKNMYSGGFANAKRLTRMRGW